MAWGDCGKNKLRRMIAAVDSFWFPADAVLVAENPEAEASLYLKPLIRRYIQ